MSAKAFGRTVLMILGFALLSGAFVLFKSSKATAQNLGSSPKVNLEQGVDNYSERIKVTKSLLQADRLAVSSK